MASPSSENCIKERPMSQTGKLCLSVFIACACLCFPKNGASAQITERDLLDSPSQVLRPSSHGDDPASQRVVSWRTLPKDFVHDQKGIWLFPTQLAKGRYWVPTLAITAGTAGLIVADPHAMPYFRSHAADLEKINDVFDAPITSAEVIALPVSLMIAGYARHD